MNEIYTIGFEGPHRVGKGEQMTRLSQYLDNTGVPNLSIRGDGSRTGLGEGTDTESIWWQEMNKKLRTPERKLEDWNTTSNRLARELIVWRDRVMPRMAAGRGVLLVDRTILSRTLIPREQNSDVLYVDMGRGRRITPQSVCPDLIIDLVAPKDVLLGRLDDNDPKYEFRKRLLEERYDWYVEAIDHIPECLRERVVRINADRPIEDVSQDVIGLVKERFNL